MSPKALVVDAESHASSTPTAGDVVAIVVPITVALLFLIAAVTLLLVRRRRQAASLPSSAFESLVPKQFLPIQDRPPSSEVCVGAPLLDGPSNGPQKVQRSASNARHYRKKSLSRELGYHYQKVTEEETWRLDLELESQVFNSTLMQESSTPMTAAPFGARPAAKITSSQAAPTAKPIHMHPLTIPLYSSSSETVTTSIYAATRPYATIDTLPSALPSALPSSSIPSSVSGDTGSQYSQLSASTRNKYTIDSFPPPPPMPPIPQEGFNVPPPMATTVTSAPKLGRGNTSVVADLLKSRVRRGGEAPLRQFSAVEHIERDNSIRSAAPSPAPIASSGDKTKGLMSAPSRVRGPRSKMARTPSVPMDTVMEAVDVGVPVSIPVRPRHHYSQPTLTSKEDPQRVDYFPVKPLKIHRPPSQPSSDLRAPLRIVTRF